MKKYIITYKVLNDEGRIIKQGTIRVKNKLSKFDAQCSLEDYLKRKLPEFDRLIIDSCYPDYLGFDFLSNNLFG